MCVCGYVSGWGGVCVRAADFARYARVNCALSCAAGPVCVAQIIEFLRKNTEEPIKRICRVRVGRACVGRAVCSSRACVG